MLLARSLLKYMPGATLSDGEFRARFLRLTNVLFFLGKGGGSGGVLTNVYFSLHS